VQELETQLMDAEDTRRKLHNMIQVMIMMVMMMISSLGPRWAVGALFRGVRRIHINLVCFNTIQLKVSFFSLL